MTPRHILYAVRDRIATITLNRPERPSADHRTRCSWFPAVPKPIIAMARVVGHAHALEFLLSGRKLDGHEALRIGLARQIHPRKRLAEATYAYAAEMAEGLAALHAGHGAAGLRGALPDAGEAVIAANQDLLVSNRCHDFREGTRAFLEKRAPRFRGD